MMRKVTKEIRIRVPEDLHQRLAVRNMESGIFAGLTSSKGVGKISPRSEGKQKGHPKEKIGETFVRLGKMKKGDVAKILRAQRDKYSFSRRFGEIAVEMGMLDQKTLEDYLTGKILKR